MSRDVKYNTTVLRAEGQSNSDRPCIQNKTQIQSTKVAFTIKNHPTSWTNPKQAANTFEARKTWTTSKDKIALTNSIKLHIPREGEIK